jgi:hypothetical protein
MNEFSAFLTATERCVVQAMTMLEFEQDKRQALLSDDYARLESMIQSQQAAIMKLESLEKQRIHAQEKAGYHRLNADEILSLLDEGPDREALMKQITDLKQTLEGIRLQNDKAMEIARANLQIYNTLTIGKDQQPGQGVYKPKQNYNRDFRADSSFQKNI